jgi:hypothetical protein
MQPLAYDPRPLDVHLAGGLLVPAGYPGPGAADPPSCAIDGLPDGYVRVRIGTGPSPGADRPSGIPTTPGHSTRDAEVRRLHGDHRP